MNRPVYDDPECVAKPYHVPTGKCVPGMKAFGEGEFYNITGLIHDDYGFPTNSNEEANKLVRRLLSKISDNYEDIVQVEQRFTDDADTVVVCFGGTTRAAIEAVNAARKKGKKVGLFPSDHRMALP